MEETSLSQEPGDNTMSMASYTIRTVGKSPTVRSPFRSFPTPPRSQLPTPTPSFPITNPPSASVLLLSILLHAKSPLLLLNNSKCDKSIYRVLLEFMRYTMHLTARRTVSL